MNYLFLRTTLFSALTVALLGIGCVDVDPPTIAPELDVRNVVFLDADHNEIPLTIDNGAIIDYSQFSTDALTLGNIDDFLDTADLVVVPSEGTLVLGLSQLLDGSSVMVISPQLDADNNPRANVGFGDWDHLIPLVDHFLPINDVFHFASDLDPVDTTVVALGYAPGGGVPINTADSIAEIAPPAITLSPVGGAFTSGAIVIVHLIAGENGIKGVSGKRIEPAKSGDEEPLEIVLPDGRKVAATIVFKIQ